MPSVQLNPKVKTNFEEILSGISSLELADVELFLKQARLVLARKKASHLSDEETTLFLKINQSFPVDLKQKYDDLITKMKANTISEKEKKELEKINKKWETWDVERMKNIVKLAEIREMPVRDFMKKHGLIRPKYVV